MKQIYLYLTVIMMVLSCGNHHEASYPVMDDDAIPQAMEKTAGDGSSPNVSGQIDQAKKKIIKNGTLNMQVTDLGKTKKRVDSLLTRYKGYYAKESQHNTDYEIVFNLEMRIPINNYEGLISDIESGNGKIIFKEIDARDVTSQFMDIGGREAEAVNTKHGEAPK